MKEVSRSILKRKRRKCFIRLGILFLIIFVILTGIFTGCNDNAGLSKQEIKTGTPGIIGQMEEITPFLSVQTDFTLSLDAAAARAAGVSELSIDIGNEFVYFNNCVFIPSVHSGKTINPAEYDMFSPFFQKIATEGFAETKGLMGCGDPHPCPPWRNSGVYGSRAYIVSYLLARGYHQTAGYACGYGDGDYTLCINYGGCNGCQMRTQAFLFQSGSYWSYRYQTPEPNPEVLNYIWPTPWWGPYVYLWHQNQCD